MATTKMTKNQMRRAKKKEQKKNQPPPVTDNKDTLSSSEETKQPDEDSPSTETQESKDEVAARTDPLIAASATTDHDDDADNEDNDAFAAYKDIFSKFGLSLEDDNVTKATNTGNQGELLLQDDDIPEEDEENTQPKLSKKKRKQLNMLSVAELKAIAKVPEVVDWQDVSSSDPRLLVQIKSQKNVVPVPSHWALKREYLSSKRGLEKSAFRLPQFIAETGIAEMRDAVLEKQAEQSLKQKQRERVAPKMGRLDIDYQKLYDAFFRFQTKPELTRFGEVYYEGKESEVDYQHFRPGDISADTREALGMPVGAPPPWLINQQRYGPPPSYPALKIPGLNAPPPAGGSWGFHPGGWGKPPVDEFNRPLYGGDVFGLATSNGGGGGGGQAQLLGQATLNEPIDRTLWGELQPREEESEEEESEEEEDGDDEEGSDDDASGLETPSGYASTMHGGGDFPPGTESSVPAEMDLRKQRRGYETEESSAPRSAYTVLPERQVRAEGFFGSDRAYDISAAQNHGLPVLGSEDETRKRKKPGDVDVAIDLDALQNGDGRISKDDIRQKFETGSKQEGIGAQWSSYEDVGDLIAEESSKRQRTEKERQEKRRQR